MRSRFLPALLACGWTVFGSACLIAAEADEAKKPDAKPTAAGIEFFEAKIRPVLVAQCYECHSAGAKQMKGALVLDTRAGIRKGGESGPAVIPGNVKDSVLIEAIRREGVEMPPKGPLPENVVADFVKWVEMGAPDPRDGKAVVASKIDVNAGKKFWAYQPVAKPGVPQVKDAAWPQSDLDRFVLAGLEAKQLQPVGDADPITWLRRVKLDLVGLQPTPEEIDQFLESLAHSSKNGVRERGSEGATDPYAAVVDKLLASPQFGERWGRHWLDIARYGESTGKERNVPYPTAWRYRDYVIDSFNADKPYDRFVTEQVAGDLLEAKTPAEKNTNLVATGFLALGPKSLNNRNEEEYLLDIADEQIDVVCRAVMATTAGCARCHDHKFDPIPQTDYYALAGIFRSTNVLAGVARQGRSYSSNMFMPLTPTGDAKPAETAVAVNETSAETTSTDGKGKKIKPAQREKLQAELASSKRLLEQLREDRQKLKGKEQGAVKERYKKLQQEVSRLENLLAGKGGGNAKDQVEKVDLTNLAMGVREGKPDDIELRIRGEVADLGPVVKRGFLSVLTTSKTPQLDPAHSGRLELAEWLASRDNPLTARVLANRVWFHLFGSGIVETIDNFGALGEKPSNPALLDHLAGQVMDQNWSIKSLIRSIVLSRAYGLSSEHQDAAYGIDPGNRLTWRMNRRRLDAEVIRDTALAAAGALDLTRPAPATGVGQNGELGRNLRLDSDPQAAVRRSVYLPAFRGLTNEMLELFDTADSSLVVGQRDVTTVATQALFLLNSPFILRQSDGVAARVLASSESEPARRVDMMYRLILARPATEHERARAVEFVGGAQSGGGDAQVAWSALAQVLFSSAEFRYAY